MKSNDGEKARDLTFEEMQELEPERKKRDDRWHKFRIAGIHVGGTGLAIAIGTLSFHSTLSKVLGTSESSPDLPMSLVAPVLVGAIIASLGTLLFARGQIALNKSHRDFMKAMAIIIEKDQSKK